MNICGMENVTTTHSSMALIPCDSSDDDRISNGERRVSLDTTSLFSDDALTGSRKSQNSEAVTAASLVSAMKLGPLKDNEVLHKSVHFAVDPNNINSILVEDIKEALQLHDSSYGFGLSLSHNSFMGSSGHLDLSFASLAYDIDDVDIELLEERVEKIPTHIKSESCRGHRQRGSKVESNESKGESKSDTEKDEKENNRIRTRKRTNRDKQMKFHDFYKRKEYRTTARVSKHAAESFITEHPELTQQFVNFYVASLVKDKQEIKVTEPDEIDQKLLKCWCESDGRGLEPAIVLSYLTSSDPNNTMSDEDKSTILAIIMELNNKRRYEQVPRLSAKMAHHLALMDAVVGKT